MKLELLLIATFSIAIILLSQLPTPHLFGNIDCLKNEQCDDHDPHTVDQCVFVSHLETKCIHLVDDPTIMNPNK